MEAIILFAVGCAIFCTTQERPVALVISLVLIVIAALMGALNVIQGAL